MNKPQIRWMLFVFALKDILHYMKCLIWNRGLRLLWCKLWKTLKFVGGSLMKGICARSKTVLKGISELLIITSPLLLFMSLQCILKDNFVVICFGEIIPLVLLAIPVQALYLVILRKVYNLGYIYHERLQEISYGKQKSCN